MKIDETFEPSKTETETVESPFGFGVIKKPKILKRDKLDIEITNYLAMIESIDPVIDPIAFWNMNSNVCFIFKLFN